MNYNPELVKFESTDHIQLPGLLYKPKEKTDKAVIYLHGNGSASVFYNAEEMNIFAQHFNLNGIAFFPFNNRGAHYIKSLRQTINGVEERIKLGTAYELIKDCVQDIDGAITFLRSKGYKTFYLVGLSTGANKIVVYDHYKPHNSVSKYILLSGGDDTGLYYQEMGKNIFLNVLKKAREQIGKDKGSKLVAKYLNGGLISYQSLYDTINPDGDYGIFPFNELMNKLRLSKKPLFEKYKKIQKPTLVVYGEVDEYCYGNVPKCVDILRQQTKNKSNFTYKIIKDADHGFTGKEQELAEIISKWL